MTQGHAQSIGDELLARLASPDVIAHRFELWRDAVMLMQFDANAYRAASFLDDRILGPSTKSGWIPIRRLVEAARALQGPRPLHFIFHTGHVGSTLASRLVEEAGGVLSLREPLAMRQLAEAHDVAGKPEALLSDSGFAVLTDTFLRLWMRGYSDTKCAIVKATSSAGRIAAPLLARVVAARAITMNLKAEPYLATLLAGKASPTDLRGHGPERMRRLHALGAGPSQALYQLSLGELTAMSWLVETWSQHEARARGGERVLAVDFDAFLSNVPEAIARILRHFGLPHDAQVVSTIARSPALTRYAKAPEHEYSPQLRAEVLAESRTRHRDEIRKGLAWLERMAASHAGANAVISRASA